MATYKLCDLAVRVPPTVAARRVAIVPPATPQFEEGDLLDLPSPRDWGLLDEAAEAEGLALSRRRRRVRLRDC